MIIVNYHYFWGGIKILLHHIMWVFLQVYMCHVLD